MLNHFYHLLKYFRWQLAAFVGAVSVFALVVSIALLYVSPIYKSAVIVSIQPSDAELRFTQAWLGPSQFNPSNILTQTHVERILSYPTAERAIEIIEERLASETGGALERSDPGLGRQLRGFIWRTWATLNYGMFAQPSEREQIVLELLESTEVEVVEGSFILRIEVGYDQPYLAALAANALADAYLEVSRAQQQETSAALLAQLDRMIDAKLGQIDEVDETLRRLQIEEGLVDFDLQLEAVTNQLSVEQEKLADDRIELSGARRRLSLLRRNMDGDRSRGSGNISAIINEIDDTEARIASLEVAVVARESAVSELTTQQAVLGQRAEPFRDVQDSRNRLNTDLENLQARRVQAEVADNAELSQFQVVQRASEPIYPSSPKVLVYVVAAMIGSTVIGMFAVTAVDLLRDRIRTPDDLQRTVGQKRALGMLPTRRAVKMQKSLDIGAATPAGKPVPLGLTPFMDVVLDGPDASVDVRSLGYADDQTVSNGIRFALGGASGPFLVAKEQDKIFVTRRTNGADVINASAPVLTAEPAVTSDKSDGANGAAANSSEAEDKNKGVGKDGEGEKKTDEAASDATVVEAASAPISSNGAETEAVDAEGSAANDARRAHLLVIRPGKVSSANLAAFIARSEPDADRVSWYCLLGQK